MVHSLRVPVERERSFQLIVNGCSRSLECAGQTFLQGGNSVSTTSPSRLFRSTDFFAQGITLGLTYRF